jgi:hypothetical protein
MSCRLCRKSKSLQNSHIVPEFVYKPLYNAKHQLFGLAGSTKVRIFQKGVRENLLCRECEQQFSRYENYAARTLFVAGYPFAISGPFKVFSGLRYEELKLFLLSLLWRFAETSQPQLTGARLGPHREELRMLLLTENPGDYTLYPCAITEVSLNGVVLRQWIIPPKRSRSPEGKIIWNMVIGGYLMSFYVTNHQIPWQVEPMLLNREGSLGVYLSDIRKIPSLMKVAVAMGKVEIPK